MHGNLGAEAGLAGDTLDSDGAVGDFGYFQIEKLADKFRIAAGQDEWGARGHRVDVQEQKADAVAHLVVLTWDPLFAGHDGFGIPKINDDIAAVEADDGARDNVADMILID